MWSNVLHSDNHIAVATAVQPGSVQRGHNSPKTEPMQAIRARGLLGRKARQSSLNSSKVLSAAHRSEPMEPTWREGAKLVGGKWCRDVMRKGRKMHMDP